MKALLQQQGDDDDGRTDSRHGPRRRLVEVPGVVRGSSFCHLWRMLLLSEEKARRFFAFGKQQKKKKKKKKGELVSNILEAGTKIHL